jgi:hypothetical protein
LVLIPEVGVGIVKDAKTNLAHTEAARALSEGRTVFVYRCNVPAFSSGFSGSVSGAAEVIETIERLGWSLANMAYDGAQSRNGALVLLFRRRG